MKKLFAKLKAINLFHYIAIAAVALSALATFVFYPLSLERIAATAADLLDSIKHWFFRVRRIEITDTARIAELPQVDLSQILPFSIEELYRKIEAMGPMLFDAENFYNYRVLVAEIASYTALYLPLVLLLIFCLWQLFCAWIFRAKPAEGFEPSESKPKKKKASQREKTRALELYLKLTEKLYIFLRDFIDAGIDFFAAHKIYVKILVGIWLVNFNIVTMIGSVLAIYFYFVSSFDLVSLLVFVARTLMDTLIMLSGAHWLFWTFVGWRILCYARESRGYARLEAMEAQDRAVISKFPVLVFAEGWMGAGKNLLTGSIKTTAAIKFRRDALDSMLDIDMRFPHFPWQALWKDLRQAVESGEICNPTPAERWMQRRHARFYMNPCKENIWGYDFDRYPMEFNDDLKIEYIWDALQDYAKLYFVYFVNSSLCFANYSMREDFSRFDIGHLPIWDTDLFHRDPCRQELESRYCHILDFDMLRLGVKMVQNNKYAGALEIGVVNITEIGKERGNQDTLREIKRLVEACNQLNDGFEDDLKMRRHPAVIRNKVYMLILTDEQRAMSWKANGREIALIARIKSRSATFLALPFFTYAEMAYDFFWPRYIDMLKEYYSKRGDMCLPVYLVKTIACFFFARHIRAVDRFGCNEQILETERGSMDGEKTAISYYIMHKKDYSNRYETNCLKGIYMPRLVRCRVGLPDVPEYKRLMASADELAQQHSHFIENTKKAG